MTRGLFAGAFWGLLTGGLILMVAALVLDHRASQPVPVPAFLTSVTGSGPNLSAEVPERGKSVVTMRPDPSLEASRRISIGFPDVFLPEPPKGHVGVPRPIPELVLPETAMFFGLPAQRDLSPNISQQSDKTVVRVEASRPAAATIGDATFLTTMVSPLPKAFQSTALSFLVPKPPRSAATSPALSSIEGGLLERSTRPEFLSGPDIDIAPVASQDVKVTAPGAIQTPPTIVLAQAPLPRQEILIQDVFKDQTAPSRADGVKPIYEPAVTSVPPHNSAFPPDPTDKLSDSGRVFLVLAAPLESDASLPDWASAVVLDRTAAGAVATATQPILVQIALDASEEQVASLTEQLKENDGAAGLFVLPSISEGVEPSDALLALIEDTPLVLGLATTVQSHPNVRPVYRWVSQDADTVARDLAAAKARAIRDGHAIVVVQDDPAVRLEVDNWRAGLDPARLTIAPLSANGS